MSQTTAVAIENSLEDVPPLLGDALTVWIADVYGAAIFHTLLPQRTARKRGSSKTLLFAVMICSDCYI